MKVLVSEKLSEHKYKTPEGYLICTDAILARTGKQTYTKDELFGDGDSTEVDVDRPYKEVFDASTLASFENKPVTVEHPNEEVNVGNYKDYAVGYVRDVHQGKTSDGQDVILGNIVITDQQVINDIEEGKHTNLSCGYDCDILDEGSGYFQHKIRGNHVALCECPRAGITKLQDSAYDKMHKYKFEYYMPFYDRKTGESGYDHRSRTVTAQSSYEAAAQLPEDAMIVRIYKDDKLFKSFTSKQAGRWHGTGNKEQLKGLDAMKPNARKDSDGAVSIIFNKLYNSDYDSFDEVKRDFDRLKSKLTDIEKEKVYKEIALTFGTTVSYIKQRLGDSFKDNIHDALSASEKDLCDYMLENCREDDEDENDLLRKMEVFYSAYSNLARNKPDEVLDYFRKHIDDSFKDAKETDVSDSFKEEPKAWNEVKAALKNEFILTREGKTLFDDHHMSFISLDMYNEADFKDLSKKVYKKLRNIASKYGTPITHSIALRKNFYVVLDVDIDKQYINDSKKLLNIVKVYKLAKKMSDAKVVNEEDLEFIKNAKKIQKRGNPKQLFVVKVISNDYAEGFASGDGGKTWETAKTRLVKRAGGNSRYQTERRFGAVGNLSVEIPFSHISWCYANNASVIPNETIDHKDGNHLNDDPSNLEPVSVKENSRRNAEFMKMK